MKYEAGPKREAGRDIGADGVLNFFWEKIERENLIFLLEQRMNALGNVCRINCRRSSKTHR